MDPKQTFCQQCNKLIHPRLRKNGMVTIGYCAVKHAKHGPRICAACYGRRNYAKDPAKRIARQQAWLAANPEKAKAYRQAQIARRKRALARKLRENPWLKDNPLNHRLRRQYHWMQTRCGREKYYLKFQVQVSWPDFWRLATSPDSGYRKLYLAYLKAGCPRRLAPSVDRIDSSQGYSVNNIRFIENYKNCGKATHESWVRDRAMRLRANQQRWAA